MEYDDLLTIATPEGVEVHLTLAGPASRFISALVDILIQGVLLVCVAVALGIAGHAGLGGGGVALLLWFVISFAVITFYDVFFEVLNAGRTPGKRMNGLRVVLVSGHPVTFISSAIRNIIRPIDFLPSAYLLGAVTILATKKNQRIGDAVAGTLVVRENRRATPVQPGVADPYTRRAYVPDGAYATWDTSRLTQEELVAVRQFLARRSEIDGAKRSEIAHTLAERLRPKVTGPAAELRGEQLLLALVAARGERTS